jgi:regulator of PEP synthase PpsR (kinase-PPPase family)
MKAVTLRNIRPELARVIRRRAIQKGISINKAVIGLLEESLGLQPKRNMRTHHDLDELAGAWTKKEAAAFDKSLADQRKIESEIWI